MFEVYLNIEIWNEHKTECGFASKVVRLPFQPNEGMALKLRLGNYRFEDVVYDMEAKVFEATSYVVAAWNNEQFLDVNYYIDEFRRDHWNVILPRPMTWRRA
jgi:hypothetical protein